MPVLINAIDIPHPVTFNAGPRITREETYSYKGQTYTVYIWTDSNGNVVRVD